MSDNLLSLYISPEMVIRMVTYMSYTPMHFSCNLLQVPHFFSFNLKIYTFFAKDNAIVYLKDLTHETHSWNEGCEFNTSKYAFWAKNERKWTKTAQKDVQLPRGYALLIPVQDS